MGEAPGAPVISFIIPVRNGAPHLPRCLESIRRTTGAHVAEVIVADNGSTDDSATLAQAAGAQFLSVPGRRVGDVRNAAAANARGDLLAFVDVDHELDGGWLDAALRLMRDPAIAAAGNQYHAPPDGTWVQRMYDRLRRHKPGAREVSWLPAGNFVVRRAAFERAGGFDGALETCEDVDLCQRLGRQGGRILASDDLRSVHHGDPRTVKAVFFGELWRGRDNLRVTLRGPLTLRSMPSMILPLVTLAGLGAFVGGLVAWPVGGRLIALAGGLTVVGIILLRAASLLTSAKRLTPRVVGQAVVLAAAFDLARGLAPVFRGGHGLRSKG